MKIFKKQFLAIIMAVAVMLTAFPMTAFAAGTGKGDGSSDNANNNLDYVFTITATDLTTTVSTYGGWGLSWINRTIYDDGNLNGSILGAYLPAGVGFTIIGESTKAYLIDTWQSSTIRLAGVWISKSGGNLTLNTAGAMEGLVTTTSTVYCGTNTSGFASNGTVSANEYVAILYKSGSMYYIEYNDSSYLRKRGWISTSNVIKWNPSDPYAMTTVSGSTTNYSSGFYVYYAPGEGYSSFDWLSSGTAYTVVSYITIHGQEYTLINYWEGTKIMAGYIKT